MPKTTKPREVATSDINGVPAKVYELKAKTKDENKKETEFSYQFAQLAEDVSPEDIRKALTYVNSKKETVDGWKIAVGYVNTAIKNAARSSKLAEINGVLALRADPEKAIQDMIQQMVVGFGVPREIAENNVRAMMSQGVVSEEAKS